MASEPTDIEREIIALLAKGDRRAIDLAYQNYGNAIYGIIIRVVKSKEVAEEVLQDVFVKVWKNAGRYNKHKGRLFTWFANIARNAAIDSIRTARAKREAKTTSTENFVNENIYGTSEMKIEDVGLKKIINSLDSKHRQLVDMAYFQGYTHSELAKELDIPIGTVKSRIRLAIKQLRDKLDGDLSRTSLLSISMIINLLQTLI